jgi:hypothetical protein
MGNLAVPFTQFLRQALINVAGSEPPNKPELKTAIPAWSEQYICSYAAVAQGVLRSVKIR